MILRPEGTVSPAATGVFCKGSGSLLGPVGSLLLLLLLSLPAGGLGEGVGTGLGDTISGLGETRGLGETSGEGVTGLCTGLGVGLGTVPVLSQTVMLTACNAALGCTPQEPKVSWTNLKLLPDATKEQPPGPVADTQAMYCCCGPQRMPV